MGSDQGTPTVLQLLIEIRDELRSWNRAASRQSAPSEYVDREEQRLHRERLREEERLREKERLHRERLREEARLRNEDLERQRAEAWLKVATAIAEIRALSLTSVGTLSP